MKQKSKNPSLKELRDTLGDPYRIYGIDGEWCLYRDFGNGFNVEVSGVSKANTKNLATLFLWFGDTCPDCMIVKTVGRVGRSAEEIGAAVERLYALSEELIASGCANWDTLWKRKGKV